MPSNKQLRDLVDDVARGVVDAGTAYEQLVEAFRERPFEDLGFARVDHHRAIRQGFPDHDAQVVHLVAECDLVATYKTFIGTHTGDFFGTPPTGRRATIRVMDLVRYRDGLARDQITL